MNWVVSWFPEPVLYYAIHPSTSVYCAITGTPLLKGSARAFLLIQISLSYKFYCTGGTLDRRPFNPGLSWSP